MSTLGSRIAREEAELERVMTKLAQRMAKADAVERRRREHRRFLLGEALEKMMSTDAELCRRVEMVMRSSLRRRSEIDAFGLAAPDCHFARLMAQKETRL